MQVFTTGEKKQQSSSQFVVPHFLSLCFIFTYFFFLKGEPFPFIVFAASTAVAIYLFVCL